MHRYALDALVTRFQQKEPKPLILRGARQVGKSTLVRMLARELGRDLVEINFEKNRLSELENSSDFSIDKVITEIEIVTKVKVTDSSLIFFDEIQAQPAALNALRYFCEDKPGLPVIGAGSLLEVVTHKEQHRMPVGRVEYYYLGPLTFNEFLLALNEGILVDELKKIGISHPPTKTTHEKAIDLLKKYYYVGGMPEAVKVFAETNDYEEVSRVHNSLIQTYRDDIPKYSKGKEQDLAQAVFNYVSQNLGEKVIYSDIADSHSTTVRAAIDLLARANVIYKVTRNRASGIPLKAGADETIMKLYYVDIGLYNASLGLQWSDIFQLQAEDLLIKGKMAEQFVAQHLAFRTPDREAADLHYWLRQGKSGLAEVDFLIAQRGVIYPIEVKSGATGKMRSLWQYVAEKKNAKTAIRFDLSLRKQLVSSISHKVTTAQGVQSINCELIGIPIYVVENLNEILS